jgi:hypothetical protein
LPGVIPIDETPFLSQSRSYVELRRNKKPDDMCGRNESSHEVRVVKSMDLERSRDM